MEPDNDTREKPLLPLRVLGWIFGGLSILNLAEDLSPVALYGNLKVWVDAYAGMINVIRSYLLAWINFKWLSVSENESHVLVLAAILCAAYGRAETLHRSKLGDGTPWAIGLFTALLYFAAVFLPAVLLPSTWGLIGSILVLVFVSALFFFVRTDKTASPESARREAIGAFVVFALLVVINYVVFRP
jgi:hypothetical protein